MVSYPDFGTADTAPDAEAWARRATGQLGSSEPPDDLSRR
jgi:hypothetical protein